MASVGVGGGDNGRRKSLDAEINLVPFIDLLSMCICFLLMTAVWIQIGALPVKQARGTDAAPSATPFDLEVKLGGRGNVNLAVKKAGKVVKQIAVAEATAEAALRKLDATIEPWLVSVVGGTAQQATAAISSAMLTPSTSAPYGDMVAVMDTLRKHRIINLGVVPNTGGAR